MNPIEDKKLQLSILGLGPTNIIPDPTNAFDSTLSIRQLTITLGRAQNSSVLLANLLQQAFNSYINLSNCHIEGTNNNHSKKANNLAK